MKLHNIFFALPGRFAAILFLYRTALKFRFSQPGEKGEGEQLNVLT